MPSQTYDDPDLMDKYGDMRLDDILRLTEPELTRAKRAWVEAGKHEPDGGVVKLVTNDKKQLKTAYKDRKHKVLVVGPQGLRVARLTALDLMRDYGQGGTYYLRDQASGYTKAQWNQRKAAKPQEMEAYGEPTFILNYLTHDTGEAESEGTANA